MRAATFPHGMTATATHDTKRGEDARMRLLALPELTQAWAHAVPEWRSYNAPLIRGSKSGPIPSPAHEYMLYQALLGAWPIETPERISRTWISRTWISSSASRPMRSRPQREGKEQTSWLAPDDNYETGLRDFVQRLLDRARSAEFITSFDAFARADCLHWSLEESRAGDLENDYARRSGFSTRARNFGTYRWSIPTTGSRWSLHRVRLP